MDAKAAAKKRANNCLAARRSRQRKREWQARLQKMLEALPEQIAEQESQYHQLRLECVTPPQLTMAEEADRLCAENYTLRLQLFELICRTCPQMIELIRRQQLPPPPWQENEPLVMMGVMAMGPVSQQHLPWQQDGLQHPEVTVHAAGIGEGFHQHHQAPPPFQPVPPPVLDSLVIQQQQHAVLQAHTGVYLHLPAPADSQPYSPNTQSSTSSSSSSSSSSSASSASSSYPVMQTHTI